MTDFRKTVDDDKATEIIARVVALLELERKKPFEGKGGTVSSPVWHLLQDAHAAYEAILRHRGDPYQILKAFLPEPYRGV